MIQLEQQPGNVEGQSGSIRQIAILLHTLPQRTHRVLLGQLGGDDKRRVADELAMLEEVDALEQYRVLKLMRDELQAETSSVEKVESEIQDEIQIGRARVSKKRTSSVYRAADASADTDSDTVSAEPDSRVSANDTEANANGDAVDSAAVNIQCVGPQPVILPVTSTHPDAVAGPPTMSPQTDAMQIMFEQFRQTQAAGFLTPTPNPACSDEATHSQHDANQILPIRGEDAPGSSPDRNNGHNDSEADAAELADRIDLFLTQLPPRELCRALGIATTKQAFLVLCGLPNEKAEAVLDMLPRRQSRKVRSDMRRMGKLQLSEIDAAKQVVAQISLRLTTKPESFAA